MFRRVGMRSLLRLGVLRPGLVENPDVGIGVLPVTKEVASSSLRHLLRKEAGPG